MPGQDPAIVVVDVVVLAVGQFCRVTLHTFIDPQAEEAPSAVESQLEDTASSGPSPAQSQPGQSSVLTTNTLTSYSQPQ